MIDAERPEAARVSDTTMVQSQSNDDVTQSGAPILRARGIVKSFGTQTVLHGIDLDIEPGLITVIIGGSGSGKSVLLKHLIGLLNPDEGAVEFRGKVVADMNRSELLAYRARIGMLFQSGALFDSMSVYENVAFPLREHQRGIKREEERTRVLNALAELDLSNAERKFPSELSGGMRKRVALARATILEPEIILYDEPTTGLDPIMIKAVDDMIAETAARLRVTSVVISHDMASTFRIAHRVAMLFDGKIIVYGTPAEIRKCDDQRVQDFIHVSGTGPLSRDGANAGGAA
jgi:phospholipid/cholesterol/gamma-HCH transport system ATP-binding protein